MIHVCLGHGNILLYTIYMCVYIHFRVQPCVIASSATPEEAPPSLPTKKPKTASRTSLTVRTRVPGNALAAVLVDAVIASASMFTRVTAALVHI